MLSLDKNWLKRSLKTRQGIAGALTAFIPVALVLGRVPADIAASIVAIVFLVDCVIRKNWNWAKKPWIAMLLILWAYSVLRACFIPHGWSSVFAAFVWVRYIFFAASAATWALEDKKWRTLLLRAIVAVVVFLSLDAVLQFIGGADILGHTRIDENTRLTATFAHPIVGITIANIFAPTLFWLIDRKKPLLSIFFGGLAFMAVLLSGERMALLFAICVMLLWLFMLLRVHKKFWPVLMTGVCAVVLLVALRPSLFKRQVESTTKIIEHVEASPYGLAWTSGLRVGEAYPLFGVGMHQFRFACTNERFGPLTDAATGYPRCYVHPHNTYMEWFAEGGIFGLTGYVAFAIILLVTLYRRLRHYPESMLLWGLGITLVVRLLPFFTSTSFFNNWSAIPLWLCVGWAMRTGNSITSESPSTT